MSFVPNIRNTWTRFFDHLLKDERRINLQNMLIEANKWKPTPARYDPKNKNKAVDTFTGEMQTRLEYYFGNMIDDMQVQFEMHFPLTHEEVKDCMLNLPLVQNEIKHKSKVFVDSGDIFLNGIDGEKITEGNDFDNFEKLKKKSMLHSSLKQTDAYTQLLSRSCFKPWWDFRAKQCRIAVYPQHLVHIVPDPIRYFDIDSARAVLFEMPSFSGIASSANNRFEVFGMREQEAAEVTQKDTVNFITDGSQDYFLNEGDVIPYIDPVTDLPIYPFVWWQDSPMLQLYSLGSQDQLSINRSINRLLADMCVGIKFQAGGVWVHVMGENGKELGIEKLSPSKVVDLPPGASLEIVTPSLNVTQVWEFAKEIMDTDALMRGLPSHAVRPNTAPEAAYALEIRSRPLTEARKETIPVYEPYLLESVRRLIIVHNTYAEEADKINKELTVGWSHGDIEYPQNPETVGNTFAAEILADVSTPVDWRMERYNEDRDSATTAVEENAEFNKNQSKAGAQPAGFVEGADAEAAADRLFGPLPVIEEDDEELEEEE